MFKNKKMPKFSLLTKMGIFLLVLLLLSALIIPVASLRDYRETDTPQRLTPPGSTFLLGSDHMGRDLMVRAAHGIQTSTLVAFSAAMLALCVGMCLGLLSGYYGGILDTIIMRAIDSIYAFPILLLGILLVTVLGTSIPTLILAIGIAFIPGISRMARGVTLSLKEEAFVEAAKLYGASGFRIMFIHLVPNILGPLIVMATLNTGTSVLIESSLSFLGIGIRPPTPSLGGLIADGRDYLATAPWIAIIPGVIITLLVMAFNLIGDGLRDMLDPTQQR